jgi:hypothetical protein
MTFEDFKAWFTAFDTTLGGKAPSLPQWWELKARLDVVEEPSRPAAPAPAHPVPQADNRRPAAVDEVDDLPPSEFTVFEEAVQLLKKRRLA